MAVSGPESLDNTEPVDTSKGENSKSDRGINTDTVSKDNTLDRKTTGTEDSSLKQSLWSETVRSPRSVSLEKSVRGCERRSEGSRRMNDTEVYDDRSCESDEDVNVTDDENIAEQTIKLTGDDAGQVLNGEKPREEMVSRGRERSQADVSLLPKRETSVSPHTVNSQKDEQLGDKDSQTMNEEKRTTHERLRDGYPRQTVSEELSGAFPTHGYHHQHQQQQLLIPHEERLLMNHNRMPLSVLQLQQQQHHHHRQQQQQQHPHQNGYLDMLYRRHLESMYHSMRVQAMQAPPSPGSTSPPGSDQLQTPHGRGGSPNSLWDLQRQHALALARDSTTTNKSPSADLSSPLKGQDASDSSPFEKTRLLQTPEQGRLGDFPRDLTDSSDSPLTRKRQGTSSPDQSPTYNKCPKLSSTESRSAAGSPQPPPSTQPLAATSSSNHFSARQALSLSPTHPLGPSTAPSKSKPFSPETAPYNTIHRPWSPAPSLANAQTPQKDPWLRHGLDIRDDARSSAENATAWAQLSGRLSRHGDDSADLDHPLDVGSADDDDFHGDGREDSPGLNCSLPGSPDKLKHGQGE